MLSIRDMEGPLPTHEPYPKTFILFLIKSQLIWKIQIQSQISLVGWHYFFFFLCGMGPIEGALIQLPQKTTGSRSNENYRKGRTGRKSIFLQEMHPQDCSVVPQLPNRPSCRCPAGLQEEKGCEGPPSPSRMAGQETTMKSLCSHGHTLLITISSHCFLWFCWHPGRDLQFFGL